MPNAISGIYAITCTVNGKQYIGSSVNIKLRWNNHRWQLNKQTHHSKHLQRAWNKYGLDTFVFSIIEEVSVLTALIEREQHYIDVLHPDYNISPTAQSCLGIRHTEETRAKLRAARRGKRPCEAAVLKAREVNLGRKHSIELKAKMSAIRRGRKLSEKHIANMRTARRGKKRDFTSPETRAKIGAGNKGKVISQEQREKIRIANIGKKRTEDTRARMSASRKGKKLSEQTRAKISKKRTGRKLGPQSEEHKTKKVEAYHKNKLAKLMSNLLPTHLLTSDGITTNVTQTSLWEVEDVSA